MNLRDLEYLVALDEHRHFGKAAAACYVSQPTLSTQLRKLENELGVELIERGGRTVLLTDAGARVVRRARRMLAEADDIRAIAKQASHPNSGTLHLGMFPTLAPYLLPHVITPLHDSFPDLEILLVEEKTLELLDSLRSGSLDAALIAMPVNDDTLHAEPLFSEEFLLAAPLGHELAESTEPIASKSLAGTDLLLLAEGHCLRDHALEVCSLSGAAEQEDFQATSLETLRHMVASGVGVTLLPELSVSPPMPPHPKLVLRRFAEPAPHRDIALVWRKTSVYRGLLPQVAAVFRELPTELVSPIS